MGSWASDMKPQGLSRDVPDRAVLVRAVSDSIAPLATTLDVSAVEVGFFC